VITLFVPCIAAMLVMIKEQGIKQAAMVWVGSWIAAFTVGGIVALFI
jgi:ferrous iron transport protein B